MLKILVLFFFTTILCCTEILKGLNSKSDIMEEVKTNVEYFIKTCIKLYMDLIYKNFGSFS